MRKTLENRHLLYIYEGVTRASSRKTLIVILFSEPNIEVLIPNIQCDSNSKEATKLVAMFIYRPIEASLQPILL